MAAINFVICVLFSITFLSLTHSVDGNKFVSDGSDFVIGDRCKCPIRSKRDTVNKAPCGPVCIYGDTSDRTFDQYKNILESELNGNNNFKMAWSMAKTALKDKTDNKLMPEEMFSLYTYTLESPKIYSDFNSQTRDLGPDHPDFQYKALYFFVHRAVNKLAGSQNSHHVYRGVSYSLPVQPKVGEPFYFNSFTSTSLNGNTATMFAKTMLFEILDTSKGALISEYSYFPGEQEVLIPPCEHFQVISINNSTTTSGKAVQHIQLKHVSRRKRRSTRELCKNTGASPGTHTFLEVMFVFSFRILF